MVEGVNQMERIILLCVTCFCLSFGLPTAVHGEDIGESRDSSNSKEDWKTRSVLLSNLKKVDNVLKDTTKSTDVVVQETVNFTKQTVIDLSKPIESKTVTSELEDTEKNLLNKTVESRVPALEKVMGTVTDTVAETTSEVTNAVNDTVNSVVYELPTVPIATPVVTEVSKTVKITTSSIHQVVEKTGNFVIENEKSTNNILKDVVVENSNTVNSENKIMKPPDEIITNDVKTVIEDDNFDADSTNHSCDVCSEQSRELVISSLPAIETDGTSDLEEHEEINMKDVDNLVVESISSETPIDRHTVVQKSSAFERENGAIEQVVLNSKTDRIKSKTPYNPSHPLEPSRKWSSLPSAIPTVASPSTTSTVLSMGGQSDLFSEAIVDVFTLISLTARQWKQTDENATLQWAHAPPGKPPSNLHF